MLCPAAVSAAAAAVWLLALLGPGLSHAAEDSSEPGLSVCSHCFYRQTPPQGASAGPRLLCHTLPGGRAFATLSKPTCDTAVYSAFHLSHDWTEREEGGELGTEEEEEDIKIAVPVLLKGGRDPSPVSPTDSPLQHWDSTVTTLVQSSIFPQCSSVGGDLYILTGAGGLGAAGEGGEGCQTRPLWTAVCCAAPQGKSGFSLGLIREAEEGERQVSVEELEEVLGLEELFSEGCGGADGQPVGVRVGLHSEGQAGNIEDAALRDEHTDSNTVDQVDEREEEEAAEGGDVGSEAAEGEEDGSEASKGEEGGSDATSLDSNEDAEERRETPVDEKKSAGVNSASADDADVREETSATSESSSEQPSDVTHSRAAGSESSADDESVQEQEKDTNSSSTLVYILSTAVSILKAPLRPVFSTITQLPGQVTYVLQEDLGVLSALPGETFSLFHLLTSDLLSWMRSAGETLLGIGEGCFCSVYYCSSSMLGALLDSCHTGVTGVGTLAGDTVGIFGDALDNAWWVTKFFGGRLWDNSEGYVGSVVSEMGGQAKAVGGGLGRLVWRSGNGVGNVFWTGWSLIRGTVNMFVGALRGAFGEESE